MKRPFLRGTNWALAGILSLLGFSGCDRIGADEYGVPWAGYAVKGTVTDRSSGDPIKDIEIKVEIPDSIKSYYSPTVKWETKTNEKGEFELLDTPNAPLWVIATDKDGPANGEYKPDTLNIDFNNAEHIGGGKEWFQGYMTETVEFKMEEKGE